MEEGGYYRIDIMFSPFSSLMHRTRGVLSITVLKELLRVVGAEKRPFEMFDLICGTSTGGIIAVLLGTMRMDMDGVETLYDNLISKIFGKGSGLKLFTEKAFYDEANWEHVRFFVF